MLLKIVLALTGHDLVLDVADWKSDEDEDLADLPLPDKSKPKADPYSLPLSPSSIQGSWEH